jgi:hypothetical protein
MHQFSHPAVLNRIHQGDCLAEELKVPETSAAEFAQKIAESGKGHSQPPNTEAQGASSLLNSLGGVRC